MNKRERILLLCGMFVFVGWTLFFVGSAPFAKSPIFFWGLVAASIGFFISIAWEPLRERREARQEEERRMRSRLIQNDYRGHDNVERFERLRRERPSTLDGTPIVHATSSGSHPAIH